jgi:hypothetical protein
MSQMQLFQWEFLIIHEWKIAYERSKTCSQQKVLYLLLANLRQNAVSRMAAVNNRNVGISNTAYRATGLFWNPPTDHKKQNTIRKIHKIQNIPATHAITGRRCFVLQIVIKTEMKKTSNNTKSKQ